MHAGLTPATPIFDYQSPHGQYGYNPNIAVDAAGNAMLAWYSSGSAGRGVLAQGIGPLGAPTGAAVPMPGTGGMTSGMVGLTPLVARQRWWLLRGVSGWQGRQALADRRRLRPAIVRTSQPSPAVTLAATADGRLWLAWVARTPGGPRVLATRSNRNATTFGAVVSGGRPRGSAQANNLSSSAAGGMLDVLANFNIGTTPATAIYHRRLLPGLTLRAAPRRLRQGVSQDVRFTVTDAGDPVSGARVRRGRGLRADGPERNGQPRATREVGDRNRHEERVHAGKLRLRAVR